MQRKKLHRVSALILVMLTCTTGCAAGDTTESSTPAMTELPPLVTATSTSTATSEISTTETSVTVESEEPFYQQAEVSSWDLPEELGALQTVRFYKGELYLLGTQMDENQQSYGSLFRAAAKAEPEFTPFFSNANSTDFIGMMDFDILSDGTVCGLLCENTASVPYDDPEFDPNTFDWESYYEDYATQYHLVWYNASGVVTQRLGLSTLLDLDETARQTMAFTGVRCDDSDRIYLTATIDEQEYLMALDGNGNLCPVQGNTDYVLSLSSAYQWVRCGTGGMILWETDSDGVGVLSQVIVTDGALWKTTVDTEEPLASDTMIAEETDSDTWYGVWNGTGLYCVTQKHSAPGLLYLWDDLHLDTDTISNVLFLSEARALLTSYDSQGNLSLQLIIPVETETTTTETETVKETITNPSKTEQSTPPVATPVNFS